MSGALDSPAIRSKLLLELVKFAQNPKVKMESEGCIMALMLALLKNNLTGAATFIQARMFGHQDLYVWIAHFFQLLPLILIELVGLHQTEVGSTPRKKNMCGMTYILKQQIMVVTIL